MKSEKQLLQIMDKIYARLYAETEPVGDWEKIKASVIDTNPRFFMDYEIDQARCDEIIAEECKKNRLKSYDTDKIKRSVYLGCSPSFKKAAGETDTCRANLVTVADIRVGEKCHIITDDKKQVSVKIIKKTLYHGMMHNDEKHYYVTLKYDDGIKETHFVSITDKVFKKQ